jgi:lipoprotein-anchoring transpeptidase ErfK/SrfK
MTYTTGGRKTIARRATVMSLGGMLALLGTGCGSGGSGTAAPPLPPPGITISPVAGARNVRPDLPVHVNAVNGRIIAVSVSAGGQDVAGQRDFEADQWTTDWALNPSTAYVVRATVANMAGQTVTETTKFQTLRPAETASASLDWILAANQGQSYGVGLPLILDFSRPVSNEAAVDQALQVTAQKPVAGAWRWITDQEAVYRTESFWPAHQTVTLQAHLAGVETSPGVYGTADQTYAFRIGAARITTVNVASHQLSMSVDGRVVRRYGISAGDASAWVYTTPSGTAVTMDKARMVIMTNPDVPQGAPGWYSEPVPLAVRITDSGIYLHQTPGAEWCLGVENCSHGCIRQSAYDAEWFYDTNQTADVVRVEGTDRPMSWDDGWTFYQMPWKQWAS